MPGADANPYMAYAAALAAGLAGVRDRVEPPAHYEGNAYTATELPRLPTSLHDALDRLEKSTLAREAFGEEVVEHYLQFLRTEQRKFDGAVTDWERARFFERV
jgi:glutamine synthetase